MASASPGPSPPSSRLTRAAPHLISPMARISLLPKRRSLIGKFRTALRVEAHPNLDYPIERVRADLERLGYRTEVDPQLPDKWAFAVRG